MNDRKFDKQLNVHWIFTAKIIWSTEIDPASVILIFCYLRVYWHWLEPEFPNTAHAQ